MQIIKLLRGSALGAIAKFAMSAGQINKLVTLPLKGIISEIEAGKTWKGPSADKFIAVLKDEHLKSSQIITGQIETMHGNFMRSIELIDQADTRGQQKANSLGELFSNIFR
ncbi:MAG: hypothetical protein KDJ52_10315 [Anaerolineae bacterium]|nr:hypothetical protein [Anaerolineae bacterium]